jgi:methylmalonyl-CoA/ethylmalonyl-CoA epimerase
MAGVKSKQSLSNFSGGHGMKIKRIAHLGLAIKDPAPPKKLYGEHLNLEHQGDEVVAGQKVQVSFFQVGESSLELLLPTAADSPVAKFLENKGEGFHHLALEVEDIDAAVEELKAAGVRLIDETPREGAHGTRVAFIHPKSTFGLLLELVQYP